MSRDYVASALRTTRDLDAGEDEWLRFVEELKQQKKKISLMNGKRGGRHVRNFSRSYFYGANRYRDFHHQKLYGSNVDITLEELQEVER